MAAQRPVRPLFIAKSYPPVIGGMERYSYDLARELKKLGPMDLIANPRGAVAMPWFAPAATAAAIWRARRGRVDLVHLSDALMAPFGVVLRRLGGVPVTVTVHGLDMTRETPPGYSRVVPPSVMRLDRVIAVSTATRDACLQRWPELAARIIAIPNGVEVPEDAAPACALPAEIEARLAARTVLLTVGRLVRRKGVTWFIREVLPRLPEEVLYVVAGEGPEHDAVQRAIADGGLGARVVLLGRLDAGVLDALYRRAEVFVMPNIVVPNDVEGFGLVSLEAAVRGTVVVAADLQGIPEAVHDGSNGFLVSPGDAEAWAAKIAEVLTLGEPARRAIGEHFRIYTADNLSWARAARAYRDCFEETVEAYRRRKDPGSRIRAYGRRRRLRSRGLEL